MGKTLERGQPLHSVLSGNTQCQQVGGGERKSDCCSVWRMSLKLLDVTLATHCHTHYQPTFKFKDLVANQHLTNYTLPINTWLYKRMHSWLQQYKQYSTLSLVRKVQQQGNIAFTFEVYNTCKENPPCTNEIR